MLYAILSDPLAAAAQGNIVVNVFVLRTQWQNHRCSSLPLANNRCGICCVQPILSIYHTPEQCVGHCPSLLPSKQKFSYKALGLWGFWLDCSLVTCKWILFTDTCISDGEVTTLAPGRLFLLLPSEIFTSLYFSFLSKDKAISLAQVTHQVFFWASGLCWDSPIKRVKFLQ